MMYIDQWMTLRKKNETLKIIVHQKQTAASESTIIMETGFIFIKFFKYQRVFEWIRPVAKAHGTLMKFHDNKLAKIEN